MRDQLELHGLSSDAGIGAGDLEVTWTWLLEGLQGVLTGEWQNLI